MKLVGMILFKLHTSNWPSISILVGNQRPSRVTTTSATVPIPGANNFSPAATPRGHRNGCQGCLWTKVINLLEIGSMNISYKFWRNFLHLLQQSRLLNLVIGSSPSSRCHLLRVRHPHRRHADASHGRREGRGGAHAENSDVIDELTETITIILDGS